MNLTRPLLLILLPLLLAAGASLGQTIPVDRTFVSDWHAAGYPGTIPNRVGVPVTEFGAVGDGTTDDTAAVLAGLSWVAASPVAGMLYFPAGTYRVTATLAPPSGVTLRGERGLSGLLSTLAFDLGGADGDCIRVAGSLAGSEQTIQPQAVHSNWVEVADPSAFLAGGYAEIRQENDPAWDNGDTWAARAAGQIVRIASIDGPVLQLERTLRADFLALYDPRIQPVEPKAEVGLDDLVILRTDGTAPVYGDHLDFQYAARCWVRGCELAQCVQRLVNLRGSSGVEVTGCYLHHAYGYGGGGHAYGVECSARAGDCLVQDNVFEHLRHSMLIQNGGTGNVYGYNFSTDPYRDEWPHDYASDIAFHGNRGLANLFEGNVVANLIFDGSHGEPAGPRNTVFRNSTDGWGLMITTACDCQALVGCDVLSGLNTRAGSDHFEWGNRIDSWSGHDVDPSGTDQLPDVSYYLAEDPLEPVVPAFWTLPSPPPVIGCGGWTFGAATNPARERFLAGGELTLGTADPLLLTSTTPTATPTTTPTEEPSPTLSPTNPPSATPPATGTPSPTPSSGAPVPSLGGPGMAVLLAGMAFLLARSRRP